MVYLNTAIFAFLDVQGALVGRSHSSLVRVARFRKKEWFIFAV
jgi:hypothetical protein